MKRNSTYREYFRFIGGSLKSIGHIRLDSCMIENISVLNKKGLETLACCCGHGQYKKTIVYRSPKGEAYELISGKEIPRKSRFYFKDAQGYYYIPEVEKLKK